MGRALRNPKAPSRLIRNTTADASDNHDEDRGDVPLDLLERSRTFREDMKSALDALESLRPVVSVFSPSPSKKRSHEQFIDEELLMILRIERQLKRVAHDFECIRVESKEYREKLLGEHEKTVRYKVSGHPRSQPTLLHS